jgi:hypothetical protein
LLGDSFGLLDVDGWRRMEVGASEEGRCYLLIVLFDHSVKKNTSAHSLNFEAFYLTS